jgi:hypothetical protein
MNITVGRDRINFPTVISKSAKSERRIEYNYNGVNIFLMVSEAKGINASQNEFFIQAIEIGADSAIYLNRSSNMECDNCSIPGIAVFSYMVQFNGLYLVENDREF